MQLIGTTRAAQSPSERRRYARYAVRCRCWIETEQTSLFSQTVDVGLGGLFLRTAVPLGEGQCVGITLDLGQGEPLVAEGSVSRIVRPRSGVRHGLGLEFVNITSGKQHLQHVLRTR